MLLTGFVLKGDKEALFAGNILYNLIDSIPIGGKYAKAFFLRQGESFFLLPYLHHIFFLPAIFILLLNNVHTWKPGKKDVLWGLFLVAPLALILHLPVNINPKVDIVHVKGPWFFWGLQEMLRYLSPFWGGIVIPTTFIALFATLPWVDGIKERTLRFTITLSIVAYFVLSIVFYKSWG